MATFAQQLIERVKVRRHNGECAFGPWQPVQDTNIPAWVGDMIADEIAEHDAEEGRVEQGGSIWVWRKGITTPADRAALDQLDAAAKVGRKIGRAMAKDAITEGLPLEWTGIDPEDVDDITTATQLEPGTDAWVAMECAAELAFSRFVRGIDD